MTPPPDWLTILREQAARTSQAAVTARLREASGNGYPSHAVVSQALSGKYKGRLDRLQALVEGVWGGAVVACPVLGDIGRDACDRHQRAPFLPTNGARIELFRACQTCPQNPNRRADP